MFWATESIMVELVGICVPSWLSFLLFIYALPAQCPGKKESDRMFRLINKILFTSACQRSPSSLYILANVMKQVISEEDTPRRLVAVGRQNLVAYVWAKTMHYEGDALGFHLDVVRLHWQQLSKRAQKRIEDVVQKAYHCLLPMLQAVPLG
jgi:hypothetical protein